MLPASSSEQAVRRFAARKILPAGQPRNDAIGYFSGVPRAFSQSRHKIRLVLSTLRLRVPYYQDHSPKTA
jgi:hypothetical protein